MYKQKHGIIRYDSEGNTTVMAVCENAGLLQKIVDNVPANAHYHYEVEEIEEKRPKFLDFNNTDEAMLEGGL